VVARRKSRYLANKQKLGFAGTFYGPNWASLEPARTFERTLKIVTIVTNVGKFDVCWSSPR